MPFEFLGWAFEPVGFEHQSRLALILEKDPQPLSDYSLPSLLAWASIYQYHHAVVERETLLVSSLFGTQQRPSLLQPIGTFPETLQRILLERARALPEPLQIESVSAAFLERHASFASHFEVAPIRDAANYIYAARDLAELAGRRYSGKRNLITQGSRLYSCSFAELSGDNAGACLELSAEIVAKRTSAANVTLAQEHEALARVLRCLSPLGLRGLIGCVDGRPAAFSVFARLNETTAVVLFEQARRSLKGLSQLINRETARLIAAQGFTSINREEDLGAPGLRKAKLSYHPSRLEMKHTLTLRG